MFAYMESFPGDYYGKKCQSGKKSGDVFNDYLDTLRGVTLVASTVTWKLTHIATAQEYESWERLMLQSFHRCDTWGRVDQPTRVFLALRRVDEEVARWWTEERHGKESTYGLWHDFTNFLRSCFMSPRRKVSCTTPVTATKDSTQVSWADAQKAELQKIQDTLSVIRKSLKLPTTATAEKIEVNKEAHIMALSEEKKAGVDKVVVCAETAMEKVAGEKVEPLSGLNMQLKRVNDEVCKTVDKGQRWSLFQTQ